MGKFLSAVCAVLLIALTAFPAAAAKSTDTVNDIQRVVDGIVDWNIKESGSGGVQEWIDGPLAANAGMGSEWYVLALCRSGENDFSAYEAALKKYIAENTVRSATARLKYALVLCALGSEDPVIRESLDNSVGQQGIMSWVYGLHLLNNGVVSGICTTEDAVEKLLDMQLDDGGWALTGANGDIDVTAMTLQALAPHAAEAKVAEAAGRSLDFLSSKQHDDGGYASFGTKNPESAAQVLVALTSIGIDCTEDERFIKNGHTLLGGILRYRLPDGSFCHKEGDPANNTATVQAFYSFLSWIRMKEGKSGLYLFAPDPLPSAPEEQGQEQAQEQEQDTPPADHDPEESPVPSEAQEPGEPQPVSDGTDPVPAPEPEEEPEPLPAEQEEPEWPEEPEKPEEVESPDVQAQTEPERADEEPGKPDGPGMPDLTEAVKEPSEPEPQKEAASGEPDPIAEEPEPVEAPSAPEQSEPEQTDEKTPAEPFEPDPAETEQRGSSASAGRFTGYKPVACLIALGVGLALCLVFFLLGKRHPKNFIAIAGMTAFVVAVILFTDVRSADEYYSGETVEKNSSFGTVTIEIRCDTIVGKSDADYIPKDGVILRETAYEIEEGDTVYDILTEAARQHRIQVETAGRWNMVYIAGINYLYELDFGDLSGWIYHVNGFAPPVGCGEYVLADGDRIQWLYSCDIGNDLLD